ncbi:MAG: hypothetical protein NVS2B14_14290 [Chamaesiphon sp.]
MIEWGIRSPRLNLSDRIKLWTTCEYFSLSPDDIDLMVLAVHPEFPPQMKIFNWDLERHKETDLSIKEILLRKPAIIQNTGEFLILNLD